LKLTQKRKRSRDTSGKNNDIYKKVFNTFFFVSCVPITMSNKLSGQFLLNLHLSGRHAVLSRKSGSLNLLLPQGSLMACSVVT
ncbi:hypothetical protein L9F63_017650, partial [Diploptera punctata]